MRRAIGMHIAQGWLKPLLIPAMAAYLAASAALVWAGRNSLLAPVSQYRPSAEWTVTAATEARIRALLDSGHDVLALLYSRLELFSALFLGAALVIGLVAALRRDRRSESDPVVLMTVALVSIMLYAAFSGGAAFCSLFCRPSSVLVGITGTPAYWFGSMIAATALIGWTAALLLHDVAVLALARRTQSPAL